MREMFWNRIEKAVYRPMSPGSASPRGLKEFFAEVMASLADRPRPLMVEIDFRETGEPKGCELDLEKGEPVFRKEGSRSARAGFGGRWLAEHPVPMRLGTRTRFRFSPAGKSRVRVRGRDGMLADLLTGGWRWRN